MSYCMIVIGEKPDMTGLNPIEVIHMDNEPYLNNCVKDFRKQGVKGDMWFLDDGCTGTSDEIVRESINSIWAGKTLRNEFLYQVLLRCELQGVSFILWYATNDEHLNLVKVTDFEEMVNLIEKKSQQYKNVNIYYVNSKSTIS